MKKVLMVLAILLAAGLAYWNWPGPAPALPQVSEVVAVELSSSQPTSLLVAEQQPIVLEDEAKIASLIDYAGQGRKTRQKSVNDTPYVDLYFTLYLQTTTGEGRTLYIYEDAGTTYLELPYEGIYKLNQPLENWLAENW